MLKLAELVTTPLLPRDYLDLVDPLRSGADLRGRIEAVHHETRDAARIVIRPGRDWLPHRPGHDAFPDRHNARSSRISDPVSLLTCFHFGGYHHEHHLHPSVPWWRLPSTRRTRA